MGFLRLFFIFFGIAICSELPVGDGTSFFRSYIAFFIMLALDYARMLFNGRSRYEKGLGFVGFIFTLVEISFCLLGTSKEFVLKEDLGAYSIISSGTFRLFPSFNMEIDTFIQWTATITIAVAVGELFVPYTNRFSKKKVSEQSDSNTKVRRFSFWGRSAKSTESITKVPKPATVSEGGK